MRQAVLTNSGEPSVVIVSYDLLTREPLLSKIKAIGQSASLPISLSPPRAHLFCVCAML
jgi:hypothetical protein